MAEVNNLKISNYKKIGSLNLLKFALVFITFLFHWNVNFSVVFSSRFVNDFVNAGAFAMSGFFVLSGFLLYYIYSKSDFSNFDYLKKFYLKRIIKILPSCYFISIFMYLLYIFICHKPIKLVEFIMQFFFMQAYFPHMFNVFLNGCLWFVSVLVFLYLLFPLLCFVVKSVKRIYLFTVIVYFLGVFPLIVNCYNYDWSLYFLPYFRVCEFIMGLICARLFLNSNKNLKYGGVFSIFITLAIFFGVAVLHKNRFINHVGFNRNYMNYDVILLILFPLLIFCLSKAKNKYFLTITQNKLSDYLGNIAYSFFISQVICIFIVHDVLMPNNYYGMNSTFMLIFSFILNMILAIIFYELFEKRVSKTLIEKLIKNKQN